MVQAPALYLYIHVLFIRTVITASFNTAIGWIAGHIIKCGAAIRIAQCNIGYRAQRICVFYLELFIEYRYWLKTIMPAVGCVPDHQVQYLSGVTAYINAIAVVAAAPPVGLRNG